LLVQHEAWELQLMVKHLGRTNSALNEELKSPTYVGDFFLLFNMQNNFKAYYQSPLGYVEINANAKSIKSIQFIDGEPDEVENSTEIIAVCIKQLDQYFNGHRKKFDFKLQMDGTPFQIMVWNELLKIEQGVTISYNQLAMQIKDTRLARAIGNAVSKKTNF